MNKRKAKKRIQYEISDVLDYVLTKATVKGNENDPAVQKNIDTLLDLFDASVTKVSEAKLLPDKKARRKHFRDMQENLDKALESVLKENK